MNLRVKNIVVNSMIVFLVIMLLIISFFVGKDISKKEKEDQQEKKREQEQNFTFTIRSAAQETDSKNNETNSKSDLQPIPRNEDLQEVIKYGLDGEKVKINRLSDFFSGEDINASREAAIQFIKVYYEFNGDNPLSHVEKARDYMSSSLYQQLLQESPRPTINTFKKEMKEIQIYEPYNVSDQFIAWMARINGVIYDQNGDISKEEVLEYRLKMVKEQGVFKVNDTDITLSN